MRKVSLSKVLLVIVLSILLVINITSVAFADDFSGWDENSVTTPSTGDSSTASTGDASTSTGGDTTASTTSTGDTTGGTSTTTGSSFESPSTTSSTDESTTTSESTTGSSLSTGSATTTLNTNDDDDDNTENEVNSLAYTGIEDNKVLPVVIVIGAIVAGYSLRKVREYNI